MSSSTKYTDVLLSFSGDNQIGTITLNRPTSLNAFGGNLMPEIVAALRELNQHPTTIFTVLTGSGRFFSAGADVKASRSDIDNNTTTADSASASAGSANNAKKDADKKLAHLSRFSVMQELMRSMIDHSKVLVLAMNGPGVGGGAAWFPGVADIVLASESVYLQIPFSALGLVPEAGSAVHFRQTLGVQRANEFLMFGRKLTVKELEAAGLVNQIFSTQNFGQKVDEYLREKLERNDGKSMMEAKRMMNAPIRNERVLAVVNAVDALAERFVDGAPEKRFAVRREEMERKSRERAQAGKL